MWDGVLREDCHILRFKETTKSPEYFLKVLRWMFYCFYLCLCTCVCVSECHVCANAHGGQRRTLLLLQLLPVDQADLKLRDPPASAS